MSNVPKPDFSLFYEKTNITADIEPHLIQFTYTDHLEGQSDELTVEFEDISGKWVRQWFPTQGDKLRAAIGYQGKPLVSIGEFEIDEVEYRYKPSSMSLKALSTGIGKANRTLKPKAYENTTLAQVVGIVADKLKLKVVGKIKAIPIKRITQYQERDVEFLARLAREYHHSFKIVGSQLVFTDKTELGQSEPVLILEERDTITLSLRDRIKDTAKAVEISAYDASGKKVVKKRKKATALRPNLKQAKAASEDTLKIVARGESDEQVEARGDAALAEQNDDQTAGNITLVGNPELVAGATIWLKNLGVFSGKYLIKSSRHSFGSNSGYTTDIEVRMVEFIADDLMMLGMETTNATP
ncbi:contractile injection system protein, VgrG/Pvc8 family [Actinobacillus porcinus]|uniref:phage late control D family protein n=1 Tax=Actinobacillus porcinus TaxID=51048 RepID=UPI002A91E6CD|nr:contractile injection system protein, VgrG/Pvc8 family [Actinobacillus porcinus]MDY5847111.1 contractile injection system protein, VgrG/Pvc8 family [Actinobacillus porcinus]